MNAAFAVVLDGGDAGGGAEGTGAGETFLVEGGWSGGMLRVAPVFDCRAEVSDGAFSDVLGDLCDEGLPAVADMVVNGMH